MDVVPLLQAKCASCHSTGGAGAVKVLMFSGANAEPQYETIKAAIGTMIEKVTDQQMPPPESGITVSDTSLQLLKTWRDEGTLQN
jgi:mono/diheme cytochrome c family protein